MTKQIFNKYMVVTVAVFGISLLFSASAARAADDPSIKGDLRQGIMDSMMAYINNQMVGETFIIYDAPQGRLLRLKFDALNYSTKT